MATTTNTLTLLPAALPSVPEKASVSGEICSTYAWLTAMRTRSIATRGWKINGCHISRAVYSDIECGPDAAKAHIYI
ncbi:hypothetical protein KSC_063640 [Ktedonobacter sp. SOSP1-52]|nr:hypothetical protein KSC_063640 [Ktedonobacter sp. SOSP1-52]